MSYVVPIGEAMDYLLKNTFTEASGARKSFPKVAMVITDGRSQGAVENFAKKLRNMGVEIFVLGTWSQRYSSGISSGSS